MSTKGLQQLYSGLTPIERFRLALSAEERGDDSELRALAEKAPTATYRMTAWPYRGMFTGLEKVMWATVIDILVNGVYLTLAWGALFSRKDEDAIEKREAMTTAAQNILTLWEALEIFCNSLEITLDQAFAVTPARDIVEIVMSLARLADPLNRAADDIFPLTGGLDSGEGIRETLDAALDALTQERGEDAQRIAVYLRGFFNHEAYGDEAGDETR